MLSKEKKLAIYEEKLLSWNDKINLIGPEARANVGAHIGEALAAAGFLQPRGRVLDFGSGGGLLSSEPRDPAVQVRKLGLQRHHFAHGAAEVWVSIPQFRPLCLLLLLEGEVGLQSLNGYSEEIFQPALERVGLREEKMGVQGKDREGESVSLG